MQSPVDIAVPLDLLTARAGLFWKRVEKSQGCWTWTGGQTLGYGRFYAVPAKASPSGRPVVVAAHRFSWMLHHGRHVPIGLVVDHRCRNRACVNPAHLEAVTSEENLRRDPKATGYRTAKPYTYTRKRDGATVWRVRTREIVGGRLVQGCKTFATERAAWDFIESRRAETAA